MDQCQIAVEIGMPWDLFWHGPLYAFDVYLAAHNDKTKEQQMTNDLRAWQIGQYALMAMRSVFNLFNPFAGKQRPPKYPQKPFLLQREEEERSRSEDRVRKSYENLLRRFPKEKRGEEE